ncbi:MAG: type II secretion system protein F [Actinomycetales bacterium]|nr:MAG: type II secretion system protein F [Actinomycetales bacterium]
MNWLEFFSTKLGVITAGGALVLGLLIISYLIIVPDKSAVPLARRRPGKKASALERATSGSLKVIDGALAGRGGSLQDRLELAGLKVKPSEFVIYVAATMLVGFAIAILTNSILMGFFLLILIPVGSILLIRILINRRCAKFGNQLDETAQMLAGSLRAGYSFAQAMSMVAQEADQPTKDEFARLTNELKLGRPFQEAMRTAADRMRNEDFMWIAQAVGINHEVGGNLADVLEGVSETIRERAELKRKVAALAAEGKLSGIVLMAMPFAIAGFIGASNPEYLMPLIEKPLGWAMVGTGLILMIGGGFWLNKTIQIKY